MDYREKRAMTKLLAYLGAVIVAVCYGAYQANPAMAIGCAVGVVAIGAVGWGVSRYKENQVKKMVADVDAGADRYVRSAEEP
jgi:hypothetical protein